MEIKEVVSKLKPKEKSKKTIILGAVGLGGFYVIYRLLSNGSDTADNVALQGAYASYPDSVTNADVIIDTINEEIDSKIGNLSTALETYAEQTNSLVEVGYENLSLGQENILDQIDKNFTATNDYIRDGLATNAELTIQSHNMLSDGLSDILDSITTTKADVNEHVENLRVDMLNSFDTLYTQNNDYYSALTDRLGDISESITSVNVNVIEKAEDITNAYNNLYTSDDTDVNRFLKIPTTRITVTDNNSNAQPILRETFDYLSDSEQVAIHERAKSITAPPILRKTFDVLTDDEQEKLHKL